MGCSSSQSSKVLQQPENMDTEATENGHKRYPPAEAFEVNLEPESESIIKKHPPKRIQRLLEEVPSTPPTIEDLTEKLANAEIRRNQILLQRSSTIKIKDTEENATEIESTVGENENGTETGNNEEIPSTNKETEIVDENNST